MSNLSNKPFCKMSELLKSLLSLRDDPDKLIEIIINQAQIIEELRNKIQELERELKEIKKELDDSNKKSNNQTAPFRIDDEKRTTNPQKPGNKPAHKGFFRPKPESIDEEKIIPLKTCPNCGHNEFNDVKEIEQIIEEIPEVTPIVTKLVTYCGKCENCQEKVQSTDPLQVSTAVGSAGTHLGPRSLAIAIELNKHKGLSFRKTCAILKNCFNLNLTPGGLSHILSRISHKLSSDYNNLVEKLRHSPVVYSDETGWWVNGPRSLWVFATKNETVYRIVEKKNRETFHETIPPDFGGVLVTDCLSVYDDATKIQHKCYSHHLKAISLAMKNHHNNGEGFLKDIQLVLKTAMALKTLPLTNYEEYIVNLKNSANDLLSNPRADPIEEKVRKRLWKQRDHLFTFLYYEEVDATNNLSERQLRPAVISRKISCGNKTKKGSTAWEILTSLAATCDQRCLSFVDYIIKNVCLFPDKTTCKVL